MSRPDLPWLREAVGLGSVFEARVARRDPARGLVELAFDGGTLLAAESCHRRRGRACACGSRRAR